MSVANGKRLISGVNQYRVLRDTEDYQTEEDIVSILVKAARLTGKVR